MKKHRKIIWILLACLAVFVLIQSIALIRCEILTNTYYEDFELAYKDNSMLGEMDSFKVLECDGETGYFLEQDLMIRTLAGKLQQKGGAAVLCLENQAVDQDFLTGKLFCNVHRLILTMLFGDS